MWSAQAAADFGLPYAFAHFFSARGNPRRNRALPKANFTPNADLGEHTSHRKPEALAAVGVICAETETEAERLWPNPSACLQLPHPPERSPPRRHARGSKPSSCETYPRPAPAGRAWNFRATSSARPTASRPRSLDRMAAKLHICGELVVNTITHDHQPLACRSYTLLAEAMALGAHQAAA